LGRDAIDEFWGEALESKCEGLMIKVRPGLKSTLVKDDNMLQLLDHGEVAGQPSAVKEKTRRKPLPATYEPGTFRCTSAFLPASHAKSDFADKRTFAWLKLKKDYVQGLGDSLDLVPIGAWHGNGRKARWWSPVLLAVWDPKKERLVAVCKCMSGSSCCLGPGTPST
jgi:DNA ligase-1